MGGFKRHLDVEFGFFGPNWPGEGSTCRGGWGPIFGSWGSDHENRAKIDPTKNLKILNFFTFSLVLPWIFDFSIFKICPPTFSNFPKNVKLGFVCPKNSVCVSICQNRTCFRPKNALFWDFGIFGKGYPLDLQICPVFPAFQGQRAAGQRCAKNNFSGSKLWFRWTRFPRAKWGRWTR